MSGDSKVTNMSYECNTNTFMQVVDILNNLHELNVLYPIPKSKLPANYRYTKQITHVTHVICVWSMRLVIDLRDDDDDVVIVDLS